MRGPVEAIIGEAGEGREMAGAAEAVGTVKTRLPQQLAEGFMVENLVV
jgi:hypothetical protein